MRKKNLLIASLMAAVLAGCSTSDGLYVGNVSNTACTRTRSGDVAGVIDNPTLKLTKEGSTITGVLKSFEVNCGIEKDVIVKCHQEGSNLLIEAHEELGDGIATNCTCPVNVYFTLYDTEGDRFRVKLNNEELGDVSFVDHHVVEIDRRTLLQANEEGFTYTETLGETSIFQSKYNPEQMPYDKPRLELSYNEGFHQLYGHYWYYRIPCSYQNFDVMMDTEEDGTIVFRLVTDGQYSADCDNRAQVNFCMINAQKDSYRIKVNPHTVTIAGEDSQTQEQTVCDFEGELKKGEHVSIPME